MYHTLLVVERLGQNQNQNTFTDTASLHKINRNYCNKRSKKINVKNVGGDLLTVKATETQAI